MRLPLRRRQSARVVLLDERGDVLLIRFLIQRVAGPFVFWATPGGGVEEGETEIQGAQRELMEELHLDTPLTGPIHTTNSRFEFDGAWIDSADTYYLARCDRDAPRLDAPTEAERMAMQEMRWWPVEELERSTEAIYPRNLAALIREFGVDLQRSL